MKMISSSEGPGIGVPIREFDTGRLPKRIISGPGARFETGRLGAGKRCFVIASGSLRRSTGLVDDLVDGLGPTFAGVFDEVEAHNPAEQVDRAAAAARFAGADCIVTIGGGASGKW